MNDHVILTPYFLDEPVSGLEALAQSDWTVNQPPLPDGDQQTRMSAMHRAIAEHAADTIGAGGRPISIAGDCCTAIGLLAGLQRSGIRPTLIWFDAHGDFNTMETTPSGFLGGMPLAMIAGRGDLTLSRAIGLDPVPENKIILSDGRDLDPQEKILLETSDVVHLSDAESLLEMPVPDGPLYVHFDVDVVALEASPAQNYPAPGGPPVELLQAVFRRLAMTDRIAAISVSTWNPALDPERRSETASMSLLATLVGEGR